MLQCDNCSGKNKGRYKTFSLEYEEGKSKLVTWCVDCLDGNVSHGTSDIKLFEHISTPFWKHMGLKAKPKEIAFEKYLKSRGMTYGDYRREQSAKARNASAYNEFLAHTNRYGTKSAPDPNYGKKS